MKRDDPVEQRMQAAAGRVAVFFAVRYLTAPMALLALAATEVRPDADRLAVALTTQMTFALLTHAIALRGGIATRFALWAGMLVDTGLLAALVAISGGVGGPLTFLFSVHAIAAGILLSSRAGLRLLGLSTVAILLLDVLGAGTGGASFGEVPAGMQAIAALWLVGGGATLFSSYNERELRRHNAELATIRRITLDIEDSLSLEEIFADLSAGVADGFGFDSVAVLLREQDELRCAAAHGVEGLGTSVPLRGRVAQALALAGPVVTSGDQARADGTLVPLLGHRGYLAVPIADDGLLIVTRAGRKGRPGTLRSNEIQSLERLAHHARLAIGNARLHARVSEMAVTDPLTGLLNHGEFQRRIAHELGRLERYTPLRGQEHHVSLILLDIDYFKKFNDRYGHPAGDAVLKGTAAAIRSAVREFDVVARYGGEEFAVILPETREEQAREVAERVRRTVAAYPFAIGAGDKPVRVTASLGIATGPANGATPARLIEQADAALYHSKDAGRNRCSHASDAPEPIGRVLRMDATRRRQGSGEGRARAGSKRARGRSSLPTRRTPRA